MHNNWNGLTKSKTTQLWLLKTEVCSQLIWVAANQYVFLYVRVRTEKLKFYFTIKYLNEYILNDTGN